MKKLEDIPKKDLFEAPEGYFDKLPGILQARVAESAQKPGWVLLFQGSLKYALPVVAIGVAAVIYLNKSEEQSAESLLASIDSTELVAYLEESDISTDELMDGVALDDDEANAIQGNTTDEVNLDETDIEELSNEFGADYF
ncbi:hypothetical protein BH09BAC3_BH09BAC3_12330 [soil metagenome]